MSDPVDPSVQRRVGYLLKRAQHAFRLCMDGALSDFDLTTPQYAVLINLDEEPGLSNAELARRSFVAPQTMIRIVTHLEERGLIERTPSPNHGRILNTTLTVEGRRALEQAHREITHLEASMLADLGPNEASELARLLLRIVNSVSQIEGGAATTIPSESVVLGRRREGRSE